MIGVLVVTAALLAVLSIVSIVVWVQLTDPWGWHTRTIPLARLPSVDAIEVSIESRPSHVVADPAAVDAVTHILQQYEDGWRVPWAGIPVGRVHIGLQAQGVLAMIFEIGPGFLVTTYGGGFFEHHITDDDQQRLLAALGITEQALKWR